MNKLIKILRYDIAINELMHIVYILSLDTLISRYTAILTL